MVGVQWLRIATLADDSGSNALSRAVEQRGPDLIVMYAGMPNWYCLIESAHHS